MNAKAKGTRNEHKSMALFESVGYLCIRSAASRSPFDFIAINGSEVVGVQVKSSSWPGAVEMEAIAGVEGPANFRRVVHRWRPYQRLPDVKIVA